ncbi:MAG: glycosyltransferase family 39 protein, partial [Candidatus Promineifilaceae bacterium]|nr:glycosyltransferase family 39 protein [Candidatus Promineifilaceae bacterium]
MSTTSQMGRGPVAEALSLWQNARAMRRWLLLLLILLAFGLRVYHLDHFGFWQDEGLTPLRSGYSLSQILSNQIILQEAVTQDTHPPFYYIVIHLTRGLFGRSDFAFRYPSVLSAILLVPILYQFGRRLAQSRRTAVQVGLLAALLAAVNPLQVWYAQEARMYSLAVLLSALATYALWRALSAERPQRWIVVYALFAGLAFTTHYTAGILVAAQVPFWLWLLWQRGQRRLILIGLGLGLLLLIPFIPFTVPRLFTGAETNYSYVSPLIML